MGSSKWMVVEQCSTVVICHMPICCHPLHLAYLVIFDLGRRLFADPVQLESYPLRRGIRTRSLFLCPAGSVYVYVFALFATTPKLESD